MGNVVEIMELDFVDISEGVVSFSVVVFDIVDVTVAIVVITVLIAIYKIEFLNLSFYF